MTVVAAHRSGFMVADSLSTYRGDWKVPARSQKIMNFGHSLVGCAGDGRTRQMLEPALRKCKSAEQLKNKAVDLMRNQLSEHNSDVLIVNTSRELILIGASGFISLLDSSIDYFSIGSGADLVIGWMGATQSRGEEISPGTMDKAIKHAVIFNNTINDFTFTEHLAPKGSVKVNKNPKPTSRKSTGKRR